LNLFWYNSPPLGALIFAVVFGFDTPPLAAGYCGPVERAVFDFSGAWYAQDTPEIRLVLSFYTASAKSSHWLESGSVHGKMKVSLAFCKKQWVVFLTKPEGKSIAKH
jgi:hypothetical protein